MTMRPPRPPVRVCSIHGLALGPQGRCVLCQRDRGAAADDEPRSPWGVLATVGVLGLAVVGTAVAWKKSGPPPEPDIPSVAVVTPQVATAEPQEEPAPPADDPRAKRVEASMRDAQERTRRAETEVSKVQITMYSITPCDLCDAARAWLGQQHFAFRERNVREDAAALDDMHRLTPSSEVPVFDIDGEAIVGFGPTNVAAAVQRAAYRRAK